MVLSEDDSDSLESFESITISVYTEQEMLRQGLKLVGFSSGRILRVKNIETHEQQFTQKFGVCVKVAIKVFKDLQTTVFNEAFINPEKIKLDFFLMALYFLRIYPKESKVESTFGLSPKWARQQIWL